MVLGAEAWIETLNVGKADVIARKMATNGLLNSIAVYASEVQGETKGVTEDIRRNTQMKMHPSLYQYS